jgi:kinesin family protein C1
VIPRAVEQVFASAKELEELNWVFEMEADFLEIYNETIQDLLSSTPAAAEHKIIHEGQNTTITGITVQKVARPAQVYELLKRAAKNRSVGTTKMNERSSRSHSLFQLRISGKNTVRTNL